ncbi:hypothetical protein ml_202 [Mollivirus sibericum]|uniref:hypothetical protein n=1 Tax=Mollivirus sibericum TaxID=1678078 RepID=UPI0006B2E1EC|nr:hypothetical protein ml_202 [Mollivirus sibericum]ALD62004.1 hypothetical protein ml_202 [Mollivirus sibericum]
MASHKAKFISLAGSLCVGTSLVLLQTKRPLSRDRTESGKTSTPNGRRPNKRALGSRARWYWEAPSLL